jgi:hypothetical protein
MDIDVQNVTQKLQFPQMGIDDHVTLVSFPSSVNELQYVLTPVQRLMKPLAMPGIHNILGS